jgi:hypothetical protein
MAGMDAAADARLGTVAVANSRRRADKAAHRAPDVAAVTCAQSLTLLAHAIAA